MQINVYWNWMAFYQIWKFYCVWEYFSYSETLLHSKWARILKLFQENNRKLEFGARRVGQKMGRVFQVPNGKDCTTAQTLLSTVEKTYICGEKVSLLKLYVGNEGRGMASERGPFLSIDIVGNLVWWLGCVASSRRMSLFICSFIR